MHLLFDKDQTRQSCVTTDVQSLEISVIRIYQLANSSNESRARRQIYNASKKSVHGKSCILPLESKYLET